MAEMSQTELTGHGPGRHVPPCRAENQEWQAHRDAAGGLPCKWPPSVVHYKCPALVGRTVGSVLSGAVAGNAGPVSDLGQIPGLSQGSTSASIARETIFLRLSKANRRAEQLRTINLLCSACHE
jgi:hypothetical protein